MPCADIDGLVELPYVATESETWLAGNAAEVLSSHQTCIYQGQPAVLFNSADIIHQTIPIVGGETVEDEYVLSELVVKRYNGTGWDDLGFPPTSSWTRDDRISSIQRHTDEEPPRWKPEAPQRGVGPVSGSAQFATDGTTLWVALVSWEQIEYTGIHGKQQIGWKCSEGASKGVPVPKYDTDDNPPEHWWSVASMYVFAYHEGGGWSEIMYRTAPTLTTDIPMVRFEIGSHPGAGYCWLASTESGHRGRHGDYPVTDAIVITTKLSANGVIEEHFRTQGTPAWWVTKPGEVFRCTDGQEPNWRARIHNYEGGYYGGDFAWDDTMEREAWSDIFAVITDGGVPLILGWIYTPHVSIGGGGIQTPPEPPAPPTIGLGDEVLVNGDFSSGMTNWRFAGGERSELVGGQARMFGGDSSIWRASNKPPPWGPGGNVVVPDSGGFGLEYVGADWKPPNDVSYWQLRFTWQRLPFSSPNPLSLDDYLYFIFEQDVHPEPWGGVGWPVEFPGFDPLDDGGLPGWGGWSGVGYGWQPGGITYFPSDGGRGPGWWWGSTESTPDWRESHSEGGAPIGTSYDYTWSFGVYNEGDGTVPWWFYIFAPQQLYDVWDFPDAPWWHSIGFAFGISNVSLKQLFMDPEPIPPWEPGGDYGGEIPGPGDINPPPLQAINASDLVILQTYATADAESQATVFDGKLYIPSQVTAVTQYSSIDELAMEQAVFYPEEVDEGAAHFGREWVLTMPADASDAIAPFIDSSGEDVSLCKNPLLAYGPQTYATMWGVFAGVSAKNQCWWAQKSVRAQGDIIQLWTFQDSCPLGDGEHGRYAWQRLLPVIEPGWPIEFGFPGPTMNVEMDREAGKIYVVAWGKYLSGEVNLRCWVFDIGILQTGMHVWSVV